MTQPDADPDRDPSNALPARLEVFDYGRPTPRQRSSELIGPDGCRGAITADALLVAAIGFAYLGSKTNSEALFFLPVVFVMTAMVLALAALFRLGVSQFTRPPNARRGITIAGLLLFVLLYWLFVSRCVPDR